MNAILFLRHGFVPSSNGRGHKPPIDNLELLPSSASTSSTKSFGKTTSNVVSLLKRLTMPRISSRTNLNTRSITYIPIFGNALSPWVILPRNCHLPTAALSVSVHLCVRRPFNTYIFQNSERYAPEIQKERARSLQDH